MDLEVGIRKYFGIKQSDLVSTISMLVSKFQLQFLLD